MVILAVWRAFRLASVVPATPCGQKADRPLHLGLSMIRRTKLEFEEHYTMVPNDWLRDKRLSRRARGLLAELMSHSVGWRVSVETLVESGPEGRDAILTALKELKVLGYLRVETRQTAEGKLDGHDYILSEPTALLENRSAVEPQGGESAPKNTNPKKTTSKADDADASSSPKEIEKRRPDVETLCRVLSERVIANGVRKAKGRITEDWRSSARLLLDRDKVPLAEALRVLNWSQDDGFWRANIQSMQTFREKYDQLKLTMERPAPQRKLTNAEEGLELTRRLREQRMNHGTGRDVRAVDSGLGN